VELEGNDPNHNQDAAELWAGSPVVRTFFGSVLCRPAVILTTHLPRGQIWWASQSMSAARGEQAAEASPKRCRPSGSAPVASKRTPAGWTAAVCLDQLEERPQRTPKAATSPLTRVPG